MASIGRQIFCHQGVNAIAPRRPSSGTAQQHQIEASRHWVCSSFVCGGTTCSAPVPAPGGPAVRGSTAGALACGAPTPACGAPEPIYGASEPACGGAAVRGSSRPANAPAPTRSTPTFLNSVGARCRGALCVGPVIHFAARSVSVVAANCPF